MTETLTISRLGHQGDGISDRDGDQVFVPFTLPGERVTVAGKKARRSLLELLEPSQHRVEPFCAYFGSCGGCRMQHYAHEHYLAWKTGLLKSAFEREGINHAPAPILHYPRANRRRAVLSARLVDKELVLGFSEKGSNRIVDITSCPVLLPAVNDCLGSLRELVSNLIPMKEEIRIHVLACENGLDLALELSRFPRDHAIANLITLPPARHFIRISINGETVIESDKPILTIGEARVTPPPGAFVQASADAETDMAKLVTGHLADCKRVTDLFSGFGTFALRIAENAVVHAVENDTAALAALDRGWRETGGKLKALTRERRDLFRQPIMAREFKKFDGAVFDPPRAGAEAQAREMAKSDLRKIAAVSCNPITLARDLRILVDGGFELKEVTPIDQFAFTPHLETVALLTR